MAESKREYVKTTYEVKFEEPPASRRGREASRELFEALVSLKDNPGDWARVALCNGNSGASALKSSITGGKKKIPDGKYEFKAVGSYPKENQSTMYARFTGE